MCPDSVSFDPIADRYDDTRGGTERGGRVAAGLAPFLRPGLVVEAGVGTGAVALPLTRLGHPVVGVDLSPAMARRARERLGARVVVGDGYATPLRPDSAPNVVAVWVTQLVPDVAGFLAALGALLAPGGHLVVVPSMAGGGDDEMADIVRPMTEALRPRRDGPEQLAALAGRAGLRTVHRSSMGVDDLWFTSPAEQADEIEARTWSILWNVTDGDWQRHVAPTVAALRAMPDAHRQRARPGKFDVVVLGRA